MAFGFIKKQDLRDLTQSGINQQGRGTGISDEALGGFRGDIGGWENQLGSGRVLPDSVYRSFDAARGGIGDERARSVAAVRAGIAQRRAQSGGLMSDAAGEEFARLGEMDANDSAFKSLTDLGAAKANAELGATRDLMDRVQSARNNILNYGEFQEQLGQQQRIAGLGLQLDNKKAALNALTSLFGSFTKMV